MATTTTGMEISASVALPRGLRLQRRRRPPVWLGVAGVLVAGVALGAALFGASPTLVLGTLAALVAIGAAVYSPALGLAVLAFSYPFDLTTYAGPLKLTTSEAVLLILALVLVGRHLLRKPAPIQRTPLDVPVVLFAVATVISLFGLTGFYSDQLVALVKAAGGFLLFFIVTQSLRERREVWVVIAAVLGAAIILAAQTILPIVQGTDAVSALNRATGNVIDPNLFAGYLVLVIPLALAAGLAIQWRWAPVASGLAMLLFGAALVATLSRGGWLGLLVGVATMAALLPGRRRVILGVAGAVVLILLIGGLAGPVAARLGASSGASPLQTLLDRIPIWSVGVSMFVQHPVFGIGVNNFGNYIGAYDPSLDVNQAHDLFLNIAAERGLLGFVAFGIFLLALFRTLSRGLGLAPNAGSRVLAAAVIASFAAFLADSLFDVAYYDYKILLLFWLLAGLAACLPRLYTTLRLN
jgi:putative inorganic carbon (hco3(-)) transporter